MNTDEKFDVILIEENAEMGIDPETIIKMIGCADKTERGLIPLDLVDTDGASCAMGFIRAEKAEELDYDMRPLRDWFEGIVYGDNETPEGIYRPIIRAKRSRNNVPVRIVMRYRF